MRRAIVFLILLVTTAALAAAIAHAAAMTFNGIGLVDYTRKPDFKVGDWVRYHMSSKSELGVTEAYDVTLVIAGEEDFWGDPGFWIESWIDYPGRPPETQASLMSYEIFGDTAATQRLQLYMRKVVSTLNDDGTPRMEINKPAASMLKTRREVKNPVRWTRDTLGVDTVQTPRGIMKTQKIMLKQGTGSTQAVGDSSIYQELREERTSFFTDEVPITHLAREDIMTLAARKAWLIGRSGDATALTTRDRGFGSARLVDFGHGYKGRIVPVSLQRSIAEQQAAERAASRPPARRRTASGGKR